MQRRSLSKLHQPRVCHVVCGRTYRTHQEQFWCLILQHDFISVLMFIDVSEVVDVDEALGASLSSMQPLHSFK